MSAITQIRPINGIVIQGAIPEFTGLNTSTTATTACSSGGSVTTTTQNPTATNNMQSCYTIATFSNCAQGSTVSFSGSLASKYINWTDDNNYTYKVIASNYTIKSGANIYGPYSHTEYCANADTKLTCNYAINGQVVIGSPYVTYSGSTADITGLVHSFYDSTSWIEISFTPGWTFDTTTGIPTSGGAKVFGGGNLYDNYATIDVNSTHTGYAVTILINGTRYSFTVGF